MKKYRLELKKEFSIGGFEFDGLTRNSNNGTTAYIYLSTTNFPGSKFDYSLDKKNSFPFTQDEIDELPHGFVKLHDIIEVEEQLYYIRIPHVKNQYVTYSKMAKCSYVFYSKNDDCTSKNKFTIEEARKYYPELANDTFLVKVEEIDK